MTLKTGAEQRTNEEGQRERESEWVDAPQDGQRERETVG